MLDKNYILNYIEECGVASGRELIKPRHRDFLLRITENTMFLPKNSPATFRVRCALEGISEVPKCAHENCTKLVNIKSSATKGEWYETFEFTHHCCKEHARKSKSTKVKKERTYLDRYGVSSYMDTAEFREKSKITMQEKYGRAHPAHFHINDSSVQMLCDKQWLEEEYKTKTPREIGDSIGVHYTTVLNYIHKHGIEVVRNNSSHHEQEIVKFIEEIGFSPDVGNREVLNGRELDIVIHDKKVAIEYDGIYWHSDKFRDKNYHLRKTVDADSMGYRLIHIFEDEWVYRKDQVKAKIRSILGVDDRAVVYARKCKHITPPKPDALVFLDDNHIQGGSSFSVCFGLEYDGALVALMSFKKSTENVYELTRYATSSRVVGGFTRLLNRAKEFLRGLGVTRIVSFADLRYSDGNMYSSCGWSHEYNTPPDYQYVVGDKRVRKQNYRRAVLGRKLEFFDPSLSERENMEMNGIRRVYNCGLMKFHYKL